MTGCISRKFVFICSIVALLCSEGTCFHHPNNLHVLLHPNQRTVRNTWRNAAVFKSDPDNKFSSAIELATKELTSTLSRIDSKRGGRNKDREWSTLKLNDENASEGKDQIVYLLRPPISPSCVIIFTGGAGLGQFPQVSYSELLYELSTRTNAAVLAIPYEVGLDHFSIAKQCAKLTQASLIKCEEDFSWNMDALPKYSLSHSLGAKLQLISAAANTEFANDLAGIGLMSFNNYSVFKTVGMIRTFISEINVANVGKDSSVPDPMVDMFWNMAEQIAGGVGLEFFPSPDKMEELIRAKITPELQQKCRLFCFDDDELDCSSSLMQCCEDNGGEVLASGLPGTHLTPVYLKIGLDDVPEEARGLASEFTGGFQGASFGDEQNLNQLVDEICGWMVGKAPMRGPVWGKGSGYEKSGQKPLIAGAIDAEED